MKTRKHDTQHNAGFVLGGLEALIVWILMMFAMLWKWLS